MQSQLKFESHFCHLNTTLWNEYVTLPLWFSEFQILRSLQPLLQHFFSFCDIYIIPFSCFSSFFFLKHGHGSQSWWLQQAYYNLKEKSKIASESSALPNSSFMKGNKQTRTFNQLLELTEFLLLIAKCNPWNQRTSIKC